jgi:hypothetical protein
LGYPIQCQASPLIKDWRYDLAAQLNKVQRSDEKDVVIWKWASNKRFSVKSVYERLTRNDEGPAYQDIWKAKIPEKVKKIMWLTAQKAILTKGNMIRRRWQGDPACYFCGEQEIVDHLFFRCPVAKFV